MIKTFRKNSLQLFFICLFAHLHICTFAQDSSHLRISMLTCTPGDELYSTFGHSAIRVVDSSSVKDLVFNYGTFNFDDEGFYLKFIRGKLMYYLSWDEFSLFKDDYQLSNRGITEQVLSLTATEKISLYNALRENIKAANKYYKYDFFFDNCTTRVRDIILKHKTHQPAMAAVMPAQTRFRQAIHQYLDKGGKDWSKLGIDILLGQPTDAVMTTSQSFFLPDNLMNTFDSSNHQQQLVLSSTNLYPIQTEKNPGTFFTPLFVFGLLTFVIFLLQFSNNKYAATFLQGFDGLFIFITGALGILLVFMWTGTDHSMCKHNYNLLWAWPTNAIAAFFINSNKSWVKKYAGFAAAGLLLVLISWFFLPQQMNNGLLPIVLLLMYRFANKFFSKDLK